MTITQNRKVLIVEDNEPNRILAEQILTGAGFSVVCAQDGQAGVETAEDESPDLIVMDLHMPRLDGYQATRHLKAMPRFSRVPILAVTALALDGDREKAMAAGCDDYLTKPFVPRDLVNLVKSHLPV